MSPSSIRLHDAGTCPDDEGLLAHLLAEVPSLGGSAATATNGSSADARDAAIGAHILVCDGCVGRTRVARSRLRLAAEIDSPVPADVARRSTPRIADRPNNRRAATSGARRFGNRWTRLPLLLPVAAAMALMVYGARPEAAFEAQQGERTRDVALRQHARTTANADLHTAPNGTGAAASRLARGTAVVLLGESDGWYRVELGDGTVGWMAKGAFE